MAITVHSPHSGKPVKIRNEDIGRAVRDEEGKIFYVVERTEGEGYYAAMTRKGSPKDEERYDQLLDRAVAAEEAAAVSMTSAPTQVHDATGKRRSSPVLRLLILLILLAAVAAGAVVVFAPQHIPEWVPLPEGWLPPQQPTPTPALPETPPPTPQLDEPTGAMPQPDAAVAAPVAHGRQSPAPAASPPALPDHRDDGWERLASGLHYRTEKAGDGAPAQAGQFVLVQLTTSLVDGPVIHSTPADEPLGFVLYSGQVSRGLDEGIAGMKAGERRTLLMPASLAQKAGFSGRAPAGSTLRCEVELVEVRPGVTITTTREGRGHPAMPGDEVQLHFAAFLEGEPLPYFSTRDMGRPMALTLGEGSVIQGLELGIAGMKPGETRSIVIPPHLAYGKRGAAGVIPPDATLRYEVELIGINASE